MREIVFDTETTGVEARNGDRIVEIGCVEIVNLAPTGAKYHVYLNPERDMSDEVIKVHGLTPRFLADKPTFPQVVEAFLAFVGDSPLVAHNAEFDRGFLNMELSRLGLQPLGQERFVDTLVLAREKFPGANNRLDALAKRFQLDRLGFDLAARKGAGGHGALLDARMLAEIYLQLKGGREQALVFEDGAGQGSGQVVSAKTVAYPARAQRPVPLPSHITEAEREAHARFLAKMPAPALWNTVGSGES